MVQSFQGRSYKVFSAKLPIACCYATRTCEICPYIVQYLVRPRYLPLSSMIDHVTTDETANCVQLELVQSEKQPNSTN